MIARGSVLLVFAALFLAPSAVRAHAQYKPFSLNRYLEINCTGEGLELSYSVTVGDIPALELRKRADDDSNGVLDEKEREKLSSWMVGLVKKGLQLTLDDRTLAPRWSIDPQWGDERVSVYSPMRFVLRGRVACGLGSHLLLVHDRSRMPALEQTELLAKAGPHCPDMRAYRLGSPATQGPIFWNGGAPPQPVQLRFELKKARVAASSEGSTRLQDSMAPLKRALASRNLGAWGLAGMLLLALGLGAAHALSPGHGKTLVAAYLVGSRGRVRHALALGLLVTFTHVFSVVILGLVALWASEKVLAERLGPYMGLAAALLVVATGTYMLVSRLRRARRSGNGEGHSHDHHLHDHDHNHHGHDHHHHHLPSEGKEVRWAELVALGVSGGLVPCPSATVVLLFAIYVGRIALGLLMILAFSLGLAATLVVLGILVVRGSGWLENRLPSGKRKKLADWLPVASAVAVILVGLAMAAVAFAGFES